MAKAPPSRQMGKVKMFTVGIQRYDYFTEEDETGNVVDRLTDPSPDSWNLTWPGLIRAALLVGRQSMFDVFQFGEWSKQELRWRSAMMRANTAVAVDPKSSVSRLVPTPAFKALDGSEKSAVSYLLGVAAAKIVAERECDVRWLMHLDVYSKPDHPYSSAWHTVAAVPDSTGRPDLIGLNPTGKWGVIEAKGRTGPIDDKLRLKSKKQTQTLATINGVAPTWRLASLIQLAKSGLKLDIVDPIDPLEAAFPLNIHPDLFMHLAYRTVFDLLGASAPQVTRVRDREFVVASLPEVDLTVGLRADIYKTLSRPFPLDEDPSDRAFFRQLKAEAIIESVQDIPKDGLSGYSDEFTDYSIGPDGTLVGLGASWRPDGIPEIVPPLAPFSRYIEDGYRPPLAQTVQTQVSHIWVGDLSHHVDVPRRKLQLE